MAFEMAYPDAVHAELLIDMLYSQIRATKFSKKKYRVQLNLNVR